MKRHFFLLFMLMGLLLACNPDKEVKSKYMSSDELQKILKEIWKSDQSYRILAGQMRQANNGVRTPSEADLWKKQTVIDSVNMNKVESIISSIGYPTKAMVGDSLKHVVAYIIMHNPKRQAKYVDLVWNAARNGDIKLLEAATLEDRVLMFSGRNQKFGTQMKYDTISTDHSTGNIVTKLRIWPIENPKIVDSLRNLIGLYPLSRQCELMNLDCGTIKGYK